MITKEAIEAGYAVSLPQGIRDERSHRERFEQGLRAALSTLPIAGEGPEGWQLVPTVATLEMEHAAVARVKPFHDEDWYRIMPKDLFRLAWKALLNAAPTPPSSPGKDGGQEVEAEDRFGMKFVVNEQVPSGEVHIRDAGGSLLGKIVNAPAADWTCAARKQSLPEPADCDWPFCGCDPHADKVIAALQECGWSASPPISDVGAVKIVPIEPTSAMIDAANESEASWKSIWPAMLAAAPVPPSSLAWDGGQEVEAARDVLAERDRQKAVEGWTPEHDDAHTDFSLAKAACIYGVGATLNGPDRAVMDEFGASGTPGWMKELWPWDIKWWKPKDRRRDLVKAAALIIAEIERLDRSALSASQSTSREKAE